MQPRPPCHALPVRSPLLAAFARLALPLVGALLGLVALVTTPAAAQEPAASGLDAGLEQQVRQIALDGSHASTPGAPRIEVLVGQLDPRLRLAPCQRVEPYLPEGTRPWGKSRIGLRCTQGSVKWNVYLPITVKVYGRALVAANAVAAGSVIGAADVAQAEVDLAEDSAPALVDAEMVVGRTAARALKVGQSLRAGHLKPRQYFAAGELVTVLAQGPGFSVASEGQALTNGIEGQLARVRTESGRVLTGQPTAERRLELGM
jgi:flagella basal body P-ring formation protein FlgA